MLSQSERNRWPTEVRQRRLAGYCPVSRSGALRLPSYRFLPSISGFLRKDFFRSLSGFEAARVGVLAFVMMRAYLKVSCIVSVGSKTKKGGLTVQNGKTKIIPFIEKKCQDSSGEDFMGMQISVQLEK